MNYILSLGDLNAALLIPLVGLVGLDLILELLGQGVDLRMEEWEVSG